MGLPLAIDDEVRKLTRLRDVLEPPPVPTDRLECYFALKVAIAEQLTLAAIVVKDFQSLQAGALVLARAADRVAVLARALEVSR